MVKRRSLLRAIPVSAGIGLGSISTGGVTVSTTAMTDQDRQNEYFVEADGTELLVDGSKFRFNGTNNYWISQRHSEEKEVEELFSRMEELGLNVLRTWGFCEGQSGPCFQPEPGTYDEEAFERLDYIIHQANKYGVRLVIPFTDNWDHYGGMDTYVEWSSTAEKHDDFYTDDTARKLFKDYIDYVLNRKNTYTGVRYKNDPTILAWELANEPQASSDPSGETLQSWIDEMGEFVKGIDSNHLLSTGLEGFYDSDDTYGFSYDRGTDYLRNHQSPHIDLCSFHLYPYHWDLSEDQCLQWIREHVRDAHEEIGKPAYLGEFGWYVDRDSADVETQLEERNRIYADWYDTLVETNADGALVWHLTTSSYTTDWSDGFDVRPEETQTNALIGTYSDSLSSSTSSEKSDDKDDPVLTVESFDVRDDSPPNKHIKLRTTWSVTDTGDALESLAITIERVSDGTEQGRETRSISGGEETGTWCHRIKKGANQEYVVTLTVGTSDGREVVEYVTVS